MPKYRIKWTGYTPIIKEQEVSANSLEEALNQIEGAWTWELMATGETLELSQDMLHDLQVESIYDENENEVELKRPPYPGQLNIDNVKTEGVITTANWQGKPIKINLLGEQ